MVTGVPMFKTVLQLYPDRPSDKCLNMTSVTFRILTLVTVFTLMVLVTSQVTFSRDWTGGKRSGPAVVDCGQFTKLCKQFIHDLKQVMSSEKFSKHRRMEDDLAISYDDDK